MIGEKIEILIPPSYRHIHEKHRGDYLANAHSRSMGLGMDLLATKKDGTEFPVEVSLSSYKTEEGDFAVAFVSDISIRKKAERELHISREFLSKAFQCIGDGVLATDEHGNVTMMNKVAEDLAGCTLAEVKGKPIECCCSLVNEITGEAVENPIKKALKEKQVVFLSNHTMIVRKDKTFNYIDDSAAPILDDKGNLIGAVMVFRDIGDKVRAQKKLTESERLLKDIIDSTMSAIYIKDLDGRFLMMNRQYEKILNVKQGEMLGTDSYRNFPEDEAVALRNADMKVIEEGRLLELEQKYTHPDGTIHHYHMTKFPLYSNGKIYGICGVSTDITESKKNIEMQEKLATQEILLKNETRLKQAQAIAHVGSWELDFATNIATWSDEACSIYGLPLDDNKHSFESWLSFIHPDDMDTVLELTNYASETLSGAAFYHRILRRDGTIRHIYSQSHFDIDTDGKPRSLYGVAHDVTDIKHMERQTLQLVENLQKKNKNLQVFAYMISHNLRSSIAKIIGLASMLEEDQPDMKTDIAAIEIIKNEVENIDTVVTDINMIITAGETAKIEKGCISFEMELNAVKGVLENNIIESNAVITTDFHEAECVNTLKSYLYSIIYNLVSNAIKYRSENRALHIQIQSKDAGDFICMSVKDNGTGIDMLKNGEKLFQLYKRFHKGNIPGRGVGLNLVKAHVESLGGKIKVESKLDEGTTFNIYFPKTESI